MLSTRQRCALESICETPAPGGDGLPSASELGVPDAIVEALMLNPLETWDVRNLYICDGSAFPTATGVNPMITIEAIVHMNTSALAERLA
jgi:hypothetical protein